MKLLKTLKYILDPESDVLKRIEGYTARVNADIEMLERAALRRKFDKAREEMEGASAAEYDEDDEDDEDDEFETSEEKKTKNTEYITLIDYFKKVIIPKYSGANNLTSEFGFDCQLVQPEQKLDPRYVNYFLIQLDEDQHDSDGLYRREYLDFIHNNALAVSDY